MLASIQPTRLTRGTIPKGISRKQTNRGRFTTNKYQSGFGTKRGNEKCHPKAEPPVHGGEPPCPVHTSVPEIVADDARSIMVFYQVNRNQPDACTAWSKTNPNQPRPERIGHTSHDAGTTNRSEDQFEAGTAIGRLIVLIRVNGVDPNHRFYSPEDAGHEENKTRNP